MCVCDGAVVEGEVWRKGDPPTLLVRECQLGQPLWRSAIKILKKKKKKSDPASLLLGTCLQKTLIGKETCSPMFIAALFTVAETRKKPQCPGTENGIRKMCVCVCVHIYMSESLSCV